MVRKRKRDEADDAIAASDAGGRGAVATEVMAALEEVSDPAYAVRTTGFFKKKYCAPGEVFVGIKVPQIRLVAKRFLDRVTPACVEELLGSSIHEHRYCGVLTLVSAFENAPKCGAWDGVSKDAVFKLLLANRSRVDNWDLVDSCAGVVVGQTLIDQHAGPLTLFVNDLGRFDSKSPPTNEQIAATVGTHLPEFYRLLINSTDFWEIRISIVCLSALIKSREHLDAALFLLQHQLHRRYDPAYTMTIHGTPFDDLDLVNKALGWMLRESGRIDKKKLILFLERHAPWCSKTTVRYATEHFDSAQAKKFVNMCAKHY